MVPSAGFVVTESRGETGGSESAIHRFLVYCACFFVRTSVLRYVQFHGALSTSFTVLFGVSVRRNDAKRKRATFVVDSEKTVFRCFPGGSIQI